MSFLWASDGLSDQAEAFFIDIFFVVANCLIVFGQDESWLIPSRILHNESVLYTHYIGI